MLIAALGLLAVVAAMPYLPNPPAQNPPYSNPPAQAPPYSNPPAQAPPDPVHRPVIYLPPTFNNPGPANAYGDAHSSPFLDIFNGPRPLSPIFMQPVPSPLWMSPHPAPMLPQQSPTNYY
ncbi:hypothetical protein TELCIR_22085 [Teladorsagia circumcincta]|uniref:Uncharacterized protein n=1 Tax=Teladorsagia circumcincta TaxID=45464 RepID=A0A2G9TEY9_TELCI|nr:hypothetical protein TELCIR_22085 [Teladorsagia circumcincta]